MTVIHGLALTYLLASLIGAESSGSMPVETSPVHVVLIGGFVSDPSPEQLEGTAGRGGNSGLYRLLGDLTQYDRVSAEYFNWNGTRAGKIKSPEPPMAAGLAESLRDYHEANPEHRLMIVGNSWGGHAAREVCELLADEPVVQVEHVIFLDPSSLARVKHGQRAGELPANVKRATNYYTRHLLSWRKWENESRVENIDLGDPSHGFQFEGGPPYDSTIDTRGHIYAEWDERIHYDIRRRIAHERFATVRTARRD
ncbi:MAG: hypothetical protein KDA93_07645 [Planctomycetaceae bacterium]|nr:hypothetical protein [Planctomycetaceae bacterium]